MQLKIQFQTTKQDSLSVSSYFSRMKNIADSLTMAGYFVSDEDFIMQLLAGLPLEHDAIIANINSSRTTMIVEEVQSLLLNQEVRIQQATPSDVISANIATKHQKRNESGRTFNFARGYDQNHPPLSQSQFHGCGRVFNIGRGRGRGHSGPNNRIYYHICKLPGHCADRCWYRYDENYTNSNNTSAFYASPDVLAHPEWLLDSGATNHVTSNSSNILNGVNTMVVIN